MIINTGTPADTSPKGILLGVPSQETADIHNHSDVDSGARAQHHTLGNQPNQAAPGNHTHSNVPIRVSGYQTANQAIPYAVWTDVTTNGATISDSVNLPFTNPDWTVKKAGLYSIHFSPLWETSGAAQNGGLAAISVNGVRVSITRFWFPNGAQYSSPVSWMGNIQKDWLVRFQVYTFNNLNSGHTLASGIGNCHYYIHRLGD